MGTPDFAIPAFTAIHDSKHQIVAVVTTPDRLSGRGLKQHPSPVKVVALKLGYPVLQPESLRHPEFIDQLRDCFADIIVVVAFKILPPPLYNIPELGAVNIHASLLPKYRGAAPIHRAILNGEKQTGVTTFQIAKQVDTGGILLQQPVPIGGNETCGELWDKLSRLGPAMIIPTLDGLGAAPPIPVPQDNLQATAAPKIDKSELELNWNSSSVQIHNQIRAFSPQPGAWSLLQGKRIKIFNSCVFDDHAGRLNPGEITPEKDRLIVGTVTGQISIGSIQLPGRQKMSVAEFHKGNNIEPGWQFHRETDNLL